MENKVSYPPVVNHKINSETVGLGIFSIVILTTVVTQILKYAPEGIMQVVTFFNSAKDAFINLK